MPCHNHPLFGTKWRHVKTSGEYLIIGVIPHLDIPSKDNDIISLNISEENVSRISGLTKVLLPIRKVGSELRAEVMVQRSFYIGGRAEFVVYFSETSGKVFLRPKDEFMDGRFQRISK